MAIVTSLSVAGPRPAAAMDLGLARQLSNLWAFVTGAPSQAPHQTASRGRSTVPQKATTSAPAPAPSDKGWGIDPNGNTITTDPGGTLGGG